MYVLAEIYHKPESLHLGWLTKKRARTTGEMSLGLWTWPLNCRASSLQGLAYVKLHLEPPPRSWGQRWTEPALSLDPGNRGRVKFHIWVLLQLPLRARGEATGQARPDLWQENRSFELDLILMSTDVVVFILKCVSTLKYIWYCQALMSN